MANNNAPFGARPIDSQIMANTNWKVDTYYVPSTDGTALYLGQFVKATATSGTFTDGRSYPICTAAAATNVLLGIVVGFDYNKAYDSQIYRTASTARLVKVITDPNVIFYIQSNGAIATTDAGKNADISVGSGSAITGLSGTTLDESSVNTTDTLQLRILSIADSSINSTDSYTGNYGIFIAKINPSKHFFLQSSGAT